MLRWLRRVRRPPLPDDPYIQAVLLQEAQEVMVDQKLTPLLAQIVGLQERVTRLEAAQEHERTA